MKKILVLNSGSSSLKYQLFEADGDDYKVIAKGLAERIGNIGSQINIINQDGEKNTHQISLPNHETAVQEMFALLLEGPLKNLDELAAVGHRMGHGGEYFDKSVIIDDDVMAKIYDTMDLLPLHGAAFVHGIEAITHFLPQIKQIATFDSAFHQSMPKKAFLYAIPLEQYEKHRIRRYGFHGTSHYYVSNEAAKMLGKSGKFISCHLGAGASITAIENGQSVDTTMGFTPMAGIIMGTRCGDLDPYIPLHIMKTQNKTADEVNSMLNKESGLFGLSRGYSDVRDIEAECLKGNPDALTAIEVYVHHVIKHIGSFVAVLGGIDALIFTAGIGENASFLRQKICEKLGYLGIKLDDDANRIKGQKSLISSDDSNVKVLIIPTNEELVIAQDTYELITPVEEIFEVA